MGGGRKVAAGVLNTRFRVTVNGLPAGRILPVSGRLASGKIVGTNLVGCEYLGDSIQAFHGLRVTLVKRRLLLGGCHHQVSLETSL